METFYYSNWQSPIGPLTLVASERGLVALEFARLRTTPPSRSPSRALGAGSTGSDRGGAASTWVESEEKLAAYRAELEEYFSGRRRRFDMPLDLRGTEFQKRCWQALLDIPYGETRTYAEIARAIGRPQAFRAVGMANHSNPIAIVVPCHRVIASDGTLCGYGGGLNLKAKLLELERGNQGSW
jgi:O-6-methylguanine DNA methyltransferase